MRQAGRYLPEYREVRAQAGDFLELCHRPELAAEVTLQPVRRFNLNAAILFADILLLPEALGQPLSFREGKGPILTPLRSATDVAKLSSARTSERLSSVMETVKRVKSELPASTALIGFAGAPWTVAAYMVEGRGDGVFASARKWAYQDPAGFQRLIDLLVASTIDYLRGQIAAGVDVVQLFDSWAGLLPASAFRRWCTEPVAAIVAALRATAPEVPVIAFPRGAATMLPAFVGATGVDAVSLDTAISPAWAASAVQPQCAVQGNLDPLALVAGGETMATEAADILTAFAGGSHIFNLGHGIVPETPPDHVAELVELVRGGQG